MGQIQGYTTGSKKSELFEVTVTQSGTNFFLDTASVLQGTSPDGSLQTVGLAGGDTQRLQVTGEQEHLLKEILTQLKINNQYLLNVVGEQNKITESDIEGG